MIGFDPDLLDFSAMPSLNAKKVRAGLEADERVLRERGFDAAWLLTDLGETAVAVVRARLAEKAYDVIAIGAGIRALVEHTHLFEAIVNAIRELAPSARFAFNSGPTETKAAVMRQVEALARASR